MSKYIIDMPDEIEWGVVTCRTEGGFFTRDFDSLEELNSDYINEHFGSLQDDAYKRGLKDAWEAARKIAEMRETIDNDELLGIFGLTAKIGESTIGTLFKKQTAAEAIEKLKAYEEKQKADDEIKVGDEVEVLNSGNKYLIAWFAGTSLCGFAHDGVTCRLQPSDVRKTGRHFDIKGILEAMKHD